MINLDVRGLSCPEPVLRVSEVINGESGPFTILLDSEASKENVARMLKKFKLEFDSKEVEGYTEYSVKR